MFDTFEYCTRLTSVTIPSSVTNIGGSAFYGCTGLTSVSIPSSVTNIGSSAFRGCTGLSSVTIPSSVTNIGNSAFYGCTGLTSVTIPSSIKNINDYTFYGCEGLTSIVLPSSITSIGYEAFYYCSNLKRIDFSSNLTSIGYYAFSYVNPTAVIFRGATPPSISGSLGTAGSKRIYVPFASIDAYKSAIGNGYSYLPLLDVMFFEKTDAKAYAAGLRGKDLSNVTSVAFYDGGIGSDMTESVIKNGMNPNCLYYAPDSLGLSGDNIISLDNYTANKISLRDSYTFDCPIPFHTDAIQYDHTPKVWANGTSGWETICLPFAPTTFMASTRGYISPIMLGSTGNFWLRKFVGASSDAVYFASTSDGVMNAHTPYIVAFPGKSMGTGNLEGQTISFIGSNADIPVTTQPELQHNGFIFTGNYDKTTDDNEGWALNSTGSTFEKSSIVGNDPFTAYFKNDRESSGAKNLAIAFGEYNDETGVFEVSSSDNGQIANGDVYSVDGRKMGKQSDNLKSGIYVVNKQKVLVK